MDRFALTASNSTLLLIDLQERFVPVIPAIAADQPCGRHAQMLLTGARLLEVPVVISEQYPKGLGPTLSHLPTTGAEVFAKTHFSCADDPALKTYFADSPRTHVIVAGIEAHVCVLATVADLIAQGKWVVVAADAVASRDSAHRDLALTAMRDLGALTLPVESILFRLQRQAGGGIFKQLSALVR
jgi:nicotinamidase-related amidase